MFSNKKKSLFLIIQLIILPFFFSSINIDSPLITSLKKNSYYFKIAESDWANATVISDGYNSSYWNTGYSTAPAITVDDIGTIHVVWEDQTTGVWGIDTEIMYANYTINQGWSNASVISDGYDRSYWNDDLSQRPAIAVDNTGIVHVVWQDYTNGTWGSDVEIMYVNYAAGRGWSNVTIISDGYNGSYWNLGASLNPKIAVGNNESLHVVWEDQTMGIWGIDSEIMYANYTINQGWSNASVISDGYNGSYWNTGSSRNPTIAADENGTIHVVWQDTTNGPWGIDSEIMYTNYTKSTGWCNATVISDGYNGIYWNTGDCYKAAIAVDNMGSVHVVWQGNTAGIWGSDEEIIYVNYVVGRGWSNVTVISDGYNGSYWNNDASRSPSIATDHTGTIHVVWQDYTNGLWGIDPEIMCVNYVAGRGWSNVTVISDGYNGNYWNIGASLLPSIVADKSGVIFVVWIDNTAGIWGNDWEIMYTASISSPPEAPQLNPLLNLGSCIFLNWTYIPTATIYFIYRNTSKIISIVGLNPIIMINLNSSIDIITSSGTYFYVIVAGNTFGNSSISNCENITIYLPPPPPFLYRLVEIENEIYLNWTNTPDTITYFVYRHTSKITNLSNLLPIYSGTNPNYTDTVYNPGTYFYVIIAGNNQGNSSISNCENITISIGGVIGNGSNLAWILLIVIPPLLIITLLIFYRRRKKKKSTVSSSSPLRKNLSEKGKK